MEEHVDDGIKKTAKAEGAVAPVKAKKAVKATRPKKTAKIKEAKPRREPIVDACVFAFRLSAIDRDLIHRAAGSGKATRFVRGAALAAANGDTKAFEELIGQAKANLK